MNLFDAINNTTTTTNGMVAHKSTNSACLDLFFTIATARGANLIPQFQAALKEDSLLALRILLWSRDVRGGAGERQRFRDLAKYYFSTAPNYSDVVSILNKIPELGRFDDLHSFVGTPYEVEALNVQVEAIKAGNGLAAKWSPRKGPIAAKLREMLQLSPKGYRKTIVGLTKVVEQQMCAKQWTEIEYSHVPSVASKNYGRAFRRHDETRYQGYLDAVMTGEKKMNATAIFPHDIVKACYGYGDTSQADAQWKSLPNYLEGVDERILTVCDVSGSMSGMPMDVSISLGLYFSERLEGVFKNNIVTFSSSPAFVTLKGGKLSDRVKELSHVNWGMSTDFEKVFTTLLDVAVRENVPQEQMPTKVLCISDMQFNAAGRFTAKDMLKDKFSKAGYEMPQLVFWNVANTLTGNVPVTMNTEGVALVSGASPAVIKSVLGGDLNPMSVMMKTVMVERYRI